MSEIFDRLDVEGKGYITVEEVKDLELAVSYNLRRTTPEYRTFLAFQEKTREGEW